MSYNYLTSKKNPEFEALSDIPSVISSQALTKPVIQCKTSTRSLPSQSGNITNGGVMFFYLTGSDTSFLKSGSCILNFNLQVVTSTGSTGSFGFNGGPCSDASSLINRVQVSIGNNVENLQFYNVVDNMITLNKTNPDYFNNELGALSGAKQNYEGAQTYNLNLSLNLMSGILNSVDSYLPLCLIKDNLTFLIEFQTNLYNAFICTNTTITSYTVSNAQIVYTCVDVEQSYINELRSLMRNEGFVYNFSSQNLLCVNVQDSTSIQQQITLSCMSLAEVHTCSMAIPTSAFQTTPNTFPSGQQTLANVYLDQTPLIQSLPLDVTSRASYVYAINKMGWNNLFDVMNACPFSTGNSATTSTLTANSSTNVYLSQYFVCSYPCSNFNEIGLIFSGNPCTTARLEMQKSAVIPANSAVYSLFIRDCVYSISGDGMLTMHM